MRSNSVRSTTSTRRQTLSRRKLLLESLESRQLLAVDGFEIVGDQLPEYVDESYSESDFLPLASHAPASGSIPPQLQLHSNPNSDFTIFLDFNGNVTTGTPWNDGRDDVLVDEPANISLAGIERAWRIVAEDFAPFDVDVTTEDPGTEALRKDEDDPNDTQWGVRVVIMNGDIHNMCFETCGGLGGLNSFDSSVDTQVYVFSSSVNFAADAASHEVGHSLGLNHHGADSEDDQYYDGHDGATGFAWNAIMGGGSSRLSTWSDGSYFDATNSGQDDLVVITTENGFGYRTDDHQNAMEFATPLRVTNSTQVSFSGIIERSDDPNTEGVDENDIDFFTFTHGGGPVSLDIRPFGDRPNLDVWAGLYDEDGDLISQPLQLFDPFFPESPSTQVPMASPGLSVSFDLTLPAGVYFLKVDGVGSHAMYDARRDTVWDPAETPLLPPFGNDPEFVDPWTEGTDDEPPVGYSDYASLGQYWINGTIVPPTVNTINIEATDAIKPEGNTDDETSFVFTLTRTGPLDAATNVDYIVIPALPTAQGGNYKQTVDGEDFRSLGFPLGLPSGFASFAAGEATTEIAITVAGDTEFEPDEYFEVLLFEPVGESVLWAFENSSAVGVIESDENEFYIASPTPEVSFQEEGDDLGGDFVGATYNFTVIRRGYDDAIDAEITVPWTVDSSAFANSSVFDPASPSDFVDQDGNPIRDFGGVRVFPSGEVVFAPGETDKVVTVYAKADRIFEMDEGFELVLGNPEYSEGPNPGHPLSIHPDLGKSRGYIENEDIVAPPTLSIEAAIAEVYESAEQVVVQQPGDRAIATRVTVTRDGDTLGNPVIVTVTLGQDTADEAYLSIGPPSNIDPGRDGPKTINIQFGANQEVFDNLYLVSVDDNQIDGTQVVTLIATAEDHVTGVGTALVRDTDGTALDRYVAKPDTSYAFSLADTIVSPGITTYIIDMTSQTWRSAAEVDKPVWQHWVQIIVPDNVVSETAVLIISGGSNGKPAPTEPNALAAQFALQTNQIIVSLPGVPSEPLVFTDEGFPRTEDEIIAYTFDKFLNGGDEEWPLLLPMVKSAVRAMDTAQEFLADNTAQGIDIDIADFVVTGASKRGWTTWLTAAADPRVSGIVPAVIDMLNIEPSMVNHKQNYRDVTVGIVGGYSEQIQDYTVLNIFDRIGTDRGNELLDIVDPYSYRDRLTMPKYLLHGSGDQFFTPDSSQFYIHDLIGPTYQRYVPNAGHGLNDEAILGAGIFIAALDAGAPLPQFDWTVEGANENVIRVNTVDAPIEVNLWQSTNPENLDFRLGYVSNIYTSTPLSDQGGGQYVGSVPLPATGGTAFFIELTYLVNGLPMKFTTEARIAEPLRPRLVSVNPGVSPQAAPDFSLSELNVLQFAPQDLTFRFDSAQLSTSDLDDIQVFASGGDDNFGDGNEIQVVPDSIGIEPDGFTVVATFTQPLPEERYRIVISEEQIDFDVNVILDFGDAPASYGTLLATGARHTVQPWQLPRLGSNVDTELDGQPFGSDDSNGVDDEDGLQIGRMIDGTESYVVFTTPGADPNDVQPDEVLGLLNPDDPSGADVSLHIIGSGYLDGWIDFNQNGAFDNDERVFDSIPVSGDPDVGTFVTLNIQTPFDAFAGMTWMRIRISDSGGLSPSGLAIGGEVEDYPVEVHRFMAADPNNAPVFDITAPLVAGVPTINVLERDDSAAVVMNGFAANIFPGSPTALNETVTQNVMFSVTEIGSPSGLMTRLPELGIDGTLTIFPAPDAVGSVVYSATLTDDHPIDPQSTTKTFVVHLRPVNDQPTLNPLVVPSSDVNPTNSEDSYAVASDGTITYTLREDNTQSGGVTEPFFLSLVSPISAAFNRIGLLDIFRVGPANESDGSPGGSQSLEFISAGIGTGSPTVDRSTDRGGTLSPVFGTGGVLAGYNYTPPKDFNFDSEGFDSFTYEVLDDGTSYDLLLEALISDPLPRTNRVQFVLNAVNDAPVFTASTDRVVIHEDNATIVISNYATNIGGGPTGSAFDENDMQSLQELMFSITPVNFDPADIGVIFSSPPFIDSQNGQLSFRTAAHVFGSYEFEIRLVDGGTNDPSRGDSNTSAPQSLTIDTLAVNDPPTADPSLASLEYTLAEEESIEILVTGTGGIAGLLDAFAPGPMTAFGDESAAITPGGNQTVTLGTPFPTTTTNGGTLQFLDTGGPPRLLYTPRANFSGMDSFVYSVTDNGQSVSITGVPFDDPRIAGNSVTLNVTPVNDAPLFGIAAEVNSSEDDGLVTVDRWATNVQAGPLAAKDEVSGPNRQGLIFLFAQTGGNQDLIIPESLTATIDPVTRLATLSYEAAPSQNGSATFEVTLKDDGPNDSVNGDQNVSAPRTFTINVAAVNDPPSFSFISNDPVTLAEDSGPFTTTLLENVSPGPGDESEQTVSFDIQPLSPQFAALFSKLPTIDSAGVLRFTTAPNLNTDNASGPVPVRISARDSEGGQTGLFGFQIEVTEVNDQPVANADSIDTNEDTVTTISVASLLANDVDPDLQSNVDETLAIRLPQQSLTSSGAQLSYDEQTGQITYDPTAAASIQSLAPGQTRTDSFTYSLIDAAGLISNTIAVSIHVDGINDAPMLVLDTPQLEPSGSTVVRVLDNDTDVDGTINPSSVLIGAQPAFGTVSVTPEGAIIYTPFGDFTGVDTFSYTVADNLGLRSAPATVTISANASPIVRDDAAETFLGEPIRIDVAANDEDSDGLDLASVVIVTQPSSGQAISQSDGTVLYVPNLNFTGNDSFSYRISDQLGRASDIATVTTSVVASRLQNPTEFADVNGDGHVTAIDALLIINLLRRMGNVSQIPVVDTDRGPNYYDVSGNQMITAVDALQVVNALGTRNVEPEAEQSLPQVAPSATKIARSESIIDAVVTDLASPDKIVSIAKTASISYEMIDTIAQRPSANDDDDAVEAAIDAAMADLL